MGDRAEDFVGVDDVDDPRYFAIRTNAADEYRSLLDSATTRLRRESDLSLGGVVLRDALQLWLEFVSEGSLYQLRVGADPTIGPSDDDASDLVSRADTTVTGSRQIVEAAMSADLNDEEALRRLALLLLQSFGQAMSEAFDGRHGPAVVIDEDSGERVDAVILRHGWNIRRRMIAETANAIPYMEEVRSLAASSLDQTSATRDEMQYTIEEINRLGSELAAARAERAQDELATHFNKLAKGQRFASNFFRVVTGLLLGGAALVGWQLAGADGWESALAHAFVAAAIGGAAAYTARLGTSHRLTADWAKSIHVQLDTFKDFLAEVTDAEVKHRMYEEFGRRVLGPPPAVNGDEPAPLPTAQVLELASIIASAAKKG